MDISNRFGQYILTTLSFDKKLSDQFIERIGNERKFFEAVIENKKGRLIKGELENALARYYELTTFLEWLKK